MDARSPLQSLPVKPLAAQAARLLGDRRLWPLFAGFAALFLIAASSLWLMLENRRQAALVEHTLEVIGLATEVRRGVRAAESDQRGYLLTREVSYLDRFALELGNARGAVASLRTMTADNPEQQANIERVRIAVEAKIAELDMVAERAGVSGSSVKLSVAGGDELTADVRAAVLEVQDEERRLLKKREAAADRSALAVLAANFAAVVVIIALGLIATEEMRRRTAQVENSERQLRLLNEGLEAAVAERTADLAESNEEIQRYAHIVSHDLRAPLVNIMGFTSELEKTIGGVHADLAACGGEKANAIKRDVDESLTYIKAAITRMDKLISELLKLSRDGRRVPRPEPLDLRQIAATAAAAIKHQVESAGARIDIGSFPPLVADRAVVEQLLGNLIDNAVKYLDPARPGNIRISGMERGGRVRIEVADNGRGIAIEDQARVFDMFRRAGPLTAPGEGVGLAYARQMTRSLGGRIELQSKPGEGSTFTLVLPTRPAALAPPAQPERAA